MSQSSCCPRRRITFLAAIAAGFGALMLPAAWALRGRGPATLHGIDPLDDIDPLEDIERLDGIDTLEDIERLDDAAAGCQASGLSGWELVTYAQRLVYRKFTYYSCRNLWDTPAAAFRRGMGYCTQYNLALKQLLERLGFDARAVFSPRVRVASDPTWAMGHTWLRVRVDGEERDVCAGHPDNLPGQVNFTPLAPVLPGHEFILFLSHLGLIGFCGVLEWRALLTGRPLPAWMFVERQPADFL